MTRSADTAAGLRDDVAPVLLANGCSMTYGSDLCDDPLTRVCMDNPKRMATAWPGVLAHRLGFAGCVNLAAPGASNDRIVRTTVDWIEARFAGGTPPPGGSLLVVIGWSHPMRREFLINGEWRSIIPYHDYADMEASLLARAYREVAWSERESAARFCTQVALLDSYLRHRGIPFLFFDAVTPWRNTLSVSPSETLPYVHYFESPNYLEAGESGDMSSFCLEAPQVEAGRHPDEAGHAAWAEALLARIVAADLATMRYGGPVSLAGTGAVMIPDRKIGLSRTPPGTADPKREGVLSRIKGRLRRDPFLYP